MPAKVNLDVCDPSKDLSEAMNKTTLIGRVLSSKSKYNFFSIDQFQKKLHIYRSVLSQKPQASFNLEESKMAVDDNEPKEKILIIGFKGGHRLMLQPFNEEKFDELKEFLCCNMRLEEVEQIKKRTTFQKVKSGVKNIAKIPGRVSHGTINFLEKVGDKARNVPDAFNKKSPKKFSSGEKKKRNPVSSIFFGAGSALKEIASAVYGLVAEPIKGAKKKGLKGVTQGLGKGVVGLIFKPVAGSIDLFTGTARGVSQMPGTLYRNIFRVRKKKRRSQDPEEEEKKGEDDPNYELIGEDEENEIYIDNNNPLAEQIKQNKQMGQVSGDLLSPTADRKQSLKIAQMITDAMMNSQGGEIKINLDIPEDDEEDENEERKKEISMILDDYSRQNIEVDEDFKDDFGEFLVLEPRSDENEYQSGQRSDNKSDFEPSGYHNDGPEAELAFMRSLQGDSMFFKNQKSRSFDALNANIPLDDSTEMFADEYYYQEKKVRSKITSYCGSPMKSSKLIAPNGQEVGDDNEVKLQAYPFPSNDAQLSDGDDNLFVDVEQQPDADKQEEEKFSFLLGEISGLNNSYQKHEEPKFDMKNVGDMYKLMQTIKDEFHKYKIAPEVNDFSDVKAVEDPDAVSIKDFIVYKYKFNKLKGEALAKYLTNWKPIPSKEDCRYPYAYKNGGKVSENPLGIQKSRGLGKEIIKEIGKKILSGDFNLTTISFPIKAMVPKSAIEMVAFNTVYFPLYINISLKTPDPLKRFKNFIVAMISFNWAYFHFVKPLNPILGETLNAHYGDGGRVYLEQISHHPPITYLLYIGPHDAYRVYGPSQLGVTATFNTLRFNVAGYKEIIYNDTKQKIRYTPPNELVDCSLIGTLTHELVGEMTFKDEQNQISCNIELGSWKKKPSDYFEAAINVKGKPVSRVQGTYLGWIDIDGQRLFDYRYCHPFHLKYERSPLGSDFQYRSDLITLALGNHKVAQKEKEHLEVIQRTDRKLRTDYKKK